jgi:hypothetical protein
MSAAFMVPEVEHPRARQTAPGKHGYYSEEARAERLLVKLLLKDTVSLRKLLAKGEI